MSHPAPTVRRRTRLIAVAAAVGLATSLAALAPAHADGPATPDHPARALAAKASQSISASAVLKSTKRKKLHVSLSAGSGGHLTVALGDKSGEEHVWSFKVAKKTLKLNSKGKGKLVTKKIKPFGTIKLTIKPAKKWKVKKCKGKVISRTRPLKVSGLFKFDSRSAWGKVGGKKVAFKGAKLVKSTGNDSSACDGGNGGGGGGEGGTCPSPSVMWSASQGKQSMSSQWKPGAKNTTLVASRSTKLAKPKGATRMDFRAARVPTPATTTTGGSVRIAVKSKKPTTGSATLSSATGFTLPRPCAGGKTYEESFWTGVTYRNGSKPLTMKMSAYPAIKLPNGSPTAMIYMQSKAS